MRRHETYTVPPVFFAHGSPMLAVSNTPAHRFLKSFAASFPVIRGIVILSAHWETEGLRLSAPGPLRTIHDFRGFPPNLYEMSYPVSAEPDLVSTVQSLLLKSGHVVELDASWGLDHGAWVPLSLAFPKAEIPVAAISLPRGSAAQTIHALGTALAPLSERGILLVGSGSTTHNLQEVAPQDSPVPNWATAFDSWLDEGLEAMSIDYFADLSKAPNFRLNHPTDEHLLPLFFPFGAGRAAKPSLMHRSYEYGSLSMSYYRFAA